MASSQLIFLLMLCGTEAVFTPDFYTAAVLEHVKENDPHDRLGSIARNLLTLKRASENAVLQGADIIVFPEVGIMPTDLTPEEMKIFYEEVPDPLSTSPWTPCSEGLNPEGHDDAIHQTVLRNLSCMAKSSRIYVVANIGEKAPCSPKNDSRCPTDIRALFYNTDVVFDSNGTLIARHRKRFLFFEDGITRPKMPEYTVFNTSFGSFGVIICFDTVWEEAVTMVERFGVENVIISTMWFDELPFISAIQFFQGWALGNKVNVLAANIHQPSTGTIGSLIVSGHLGVLTYSFEPNLDQSKLLISKVPRTESFTISTSSYISKSLKGYHHMNTDFKEYTLVKLTEVTGSIKSCNNGLCCKLNYTSRSSPNNLYLGSFSGIRDVNNHYFLCQEVCVLVLCANGSACTEFPTTSEAGFDSISLTGNITTKHQYPSVLASGMVLVPYAKWEFSLGNITIHSGTIKEPLLSVGIHGRCYDKDPPYPDEISQLLV